MVDRGLLESKRNSLMAMSAIKVLGQYCDVETYKFSDDILKSLRHVMRFYRHCSCLTIHLDPAQVEEKLGQHCLTRLWRHRIRDIVSNFYTESKPMRMSGSRLRLEFKQSKYVSFETSAWELITDDDMIIFDRCINMYIDYLRQVTDRGVTALKNVRSLRMICADNVTGEGLIDLAMNHHLEYLLICGSKADSRFTQASLKFLRAMRKRLVFDDRLT